MTQDEFQVEAESLRRQLVAEADGYLHDTDGAEDAVQDALMRLWQVRDTLRSPMTAIAKVVVRNICLDRLRRTKPKTDIENAETVSEDDDGNQQHNEAIDRMMAIVKMLPPQQQMIIQLRHFDGLEMSGIAMLMGMSEVAVRKALSRARQAVKAQYLKKYKEDEQ